MIRNRIKTSIIILIVLVIAAAAWYARPVTFRTLIENQDFKTIGVSVRSEAEFPEHNNLHNLTFTAGTPEMDALLEHLEPIHFHRSPLEPLLPFLPSFSHWVTVEPEEDYVIYFAIYDEQDHFLQHLEFWINEWCYGPETKLPLYVVNGQEKGRELGAWLWEMAQEKQSNSDDLPEI